MRLNTKYITGNTHTVSIIIDNISHWIGIADITDTILYCFHYWYWYYWLRCHILKAMIVLRPSAELSFQPQYYAITFSHTLCQRAVRHTALMAAAPAFSFELLLFRVSARLAGRRCRHFDYFRQPLRQLYRRHYAIAFQLRARAAFTFGFQPAIGQFQLSPAELIVTLSPKMMPLSADLIISLRMTLADIDFHFDIFDTPFWCW